jgi:transposase-like protein
MRSEDWQRAIAGRRAWTAAEARRALAACEASGLSIAEFARQCGSTAWRFYSWRKRFEDQAPAEETTRLLPVKVVESGARFVAREARVVLVDGRLRVEVEGMSAEWVATLIRLVRGSDG